MPNSPKTVLKLLLWGTALGAVGVTSAIMVASVAPAAYVVRRVLKVLG